VSLKTELQRLGLLVEDVHLEPGHQTLLVLCNDGLLDGGMSVALDLRPDELIGPLCERIGGQARSLKVLDARDEPEPELLVDAGGGEEAWPVRDPRDLVDRVNEAFASDSQARPVAVLGEWEDMLQLWCVPREALPSLLRAPFFQAENRSRLSALLPRASRGPR